MSRTEQARVGRPRAAGRESSDLEPREQILAAAAELFAEHGYAGTSTRAIAERVGIRQASLYYHFAGKDEILLELLEASVRPSLDVAEWLVAAPDPAGALWALVTVDVGTLLHAAHNVGVMYLAHEVEQAPFEHFRLHRAALQAAYATLAARIRPDGDAAFLGACCMQLVELVIQLRREGEPSAGVAVQIAEACLRVVGVDPAGAAVAGEALLDAAR